MPVMVVSLFSCGNDKIKKPIDLLIRVDTDLNGTKYQTFYTYDKSYRLTKVEEIEYKDGSEEIHSDTIDTFTYRGNSGSKIRCMDHLWICEGKEETTSNTTYTYDSKGNLTEMEEIGVSSGTNFKNKLNFTYNKQNLLTSSNNYRANSGDYEIIDEHTYEYNTHKDVIKDIEVYHPSSSQSGTTTFTYDEYYCCIHEEKDYDKEGKENSYVDTTYYKNNPSKPKHKYISIQEGDNIDYEYDELDRLKYTDSLDSCENTRHEDYYYDE